MEDYKSLAEELKDRGNESFQAGDLQEAIQFYSQAIELDPDNYIYYSNRCAAYMKTDSKSKALKDAERCVELNPSFVKGYSRLGAAQQSLKRFEAAMDTFKKGIALDPNNQGLWSALVACQESFEADKKERFADAAVERQREEDYLRRKEAAKERARAEAAPAASTATSTGEKEVEADENDLLNSFFSAITSEVKPSVPLVPPPTSASEDTEEVFSHDKYSTQDLGTGIDQVLRLTGPNAQFKNLNPYAVLQLDIDATEEDIKNRYRKLSTRVHPDKLLDVPAAREAFEEVKKAYQKLCEEDQRKTVIMNIEFVKAEVLKERRRLLNKGVLRMLSIFYYFYF